MKAAVALELCEGRRVLGRMRRTRPAIYGEESGVGNNAGRRYGAAADSAAAESDADTT